MKEKLLSKEELQSLTPLFRGRGGNFFLKIGKWLTGVNKINRIYDESKHLSGAEFCQHMLDNIGVNIIVKNIEVLDKFKNQPFITVSNHAYGHIDGIAAIAKIGAKRPDYKMMVNFILGLIDTMAMHFIVVNPYKSGKLAAKSSLDGIKESIEHLKEGHPLGFFPAGAVSKTKIKNFRIATEDREWQTPVLKLIKKAQVPVIPLYFSGRNSLFFTILDLINWKLRSLRLGHEILNKRGKTIYLKFGDPIYPEEQAKYNTTKDLGNFLKKKTYELA